MKLLIKCSLKRYVFNLPTIIYCKSVVKSDDTKSQPCNILYIGCIFNYVEYVQVVYFSDRLHIYEAALNSDRILNHSGAIGASKTIGI